jgi:hypothetical protein
MVSHRTYWRSGSRADPVGDLPPKPADANVLIDQMAQVGMDYEITQPAQGE